MTWRAKNMPVVGTRAESFGKIALKIVCWDGENSTKYYGPKRDIDTAERSN